MAKAKSGGKAKKSEKPSDVGPYGFDDDQEQGEEEPEEADEPLEETPEVTRKRKEPIAPPPAHCIPAKKAMKMEPSEPGNAKSPEEPNSVPSNAKTPRQPAGDAKTPSESGDARTPGKPSESGDAKTASEEPAHAPQVENTKNPEALTAAAADDTQATQDGTQLGGDATGAPNMQAILEASLAKIKELEDRLNEKVSSGSSGPTSPEQPDNQEGLTPEPSEQELPVEASMEEPKDPLPEELQPPAQPSIESAPDASDKSLMNSKALDNAIFHGPPDSADGALDKTPDVAVEPGNAATVPEPEQQAAPAKAPEAEVPAPSSVAGPPDRTLELAGMEALLKNQKVREQLEHQQQLAQAKQVRAQQGCVLNTPHVEINWTTHRKEGMRLKRLMEESSEGQAAIDCSLADRRFECNCSNFCSQFFVFELNWGRWHAANFAELAGTDD
eukprot:s2212_g11.t1